MHKSRRWSYKLHHHIKHSHTPNDNFQSHFTGVMMKTKRRATPLLTKPEQTTPPTTNITNPSMERDVACALLAPKSIEPQYSRMISRLENSIIRRSQRIQNAVYHQPRIRDNTEPVIQIIDPSGSEKDDPRNPEEVYEEPEPNQSQMQDIEPAPQNQDQAGSEKESEDDPSDENSLEQEPEQQIQEKTKKAHTGSQNKTETRYRALYLESQKKVDELTLAKNELSQKLAIAEGKLEVYEKGSGILASILDKAKDVFMASALSKATEQVLASAASPVKPKRKRKPSNAAATKKKNKPVASLG
ncbi:hypothetical protein QQ045_022729 [Rhodiola kirilowii]